MSHYPIMLVQIDVRAGAASNTKSWGEMSAKNPWEITLAQIITFRCCVFKSKHAHVTSKLILVFVDFFSGRGNTTLELWEYRHQEL